MNAYLTVPDIAEILGLSRQRIYQLTLQEHRIPFIRIGKAVRIPRTAWDAWLAAQHDEAMSNVRQEMAHAC